MCGATSIGEAARRISEGAAMIRTKGEAGTGDIVEGVRHIRMIKNGIQHIVSTDDNQLGAVAKEYNAPIEVLQQIRSQKKLPVVNFAAGGIATPADAALMMQLGCEGVFVGSGIFKSDNPSERASAIVQATTHFEDPDMIKDISRRIGNPMPSISAKDLDESDKLSKRGW